VVAWLLASHQAELALANLAQQRSQNQVVGQLASQVAQSSNQMIQLLQQANIAGGTTGPGTGNFPGGFGPNPTPPAGPSPIDLRGSAAPGALPQAGAAAAGAANRIANRLPAQAPAANEAANRIGTNAAPNRLGANAAAANRTGDTTNLENGQLGTGARLGAGGFAGGGELLQAIQAAGNNFDIIYAGLVAAQQTDRLIALGAVQGFVSPQMQQVLSQEQALSQQNLQAALNVLTQGATAAPQLNRDAAGGGTLNNNVRNRGAAINRAVTPSPTTPRTNNAVPR
jgi:hypothetical protein